MLLCSIVDKILVSDATLIVGVTFFFCVVRSHCQSVGRDEDVKNENDGTTFLESQTGNESTQPDNDECVQIVELATVVFRCQ